MGPLLTTRHGAEFCHRPVVEVGGVEPPSVVVRGVCYLGDWGRCITAALHHQLFVRKLETAEGGTHMKRQLSVPRRCGPGGLGSRAKSSFVASYGFAGF